MKKITVLTPCFNEEDGINECYEQVKEVFQKKLQNYTYEHIFIDNCSNDSTVAIIKGICERDKAVKLIVNSRNFGLSRSPYYGKLQMTGDALIPVVADLQTPASVIPNLVEKWEEGFPIVLAIRVGMSESFFTRFFRNTFYKIINRLSNIEQYDHFIGFGLFDSKIIDIFRSFDEPSPYFRGMVSEVGFEKAFVEYIQPPRKHGKSRHSFFDLFELALLGLTTYSKFPLRAMIYVGFILSMAFSLMGFLYIAFKVMYWESFQLGMAPILIAIFFISSVQMLCFGLIGQYISLIFDKVQKRPLVIEKERVNFDA